MSAEEASGSRVVAEAQRVSIVGVGRAGTNLLGRAIGVGISPSHCVAINDDRGQLSRSPARNKILIESDLARPLEGEPARGGDPFQSAYRVRPYTEDSDLTVVVVGLGGTTGTKAAPLVAQYARTYVKPVVSVVAIPFIHEREKRFTALRGLKKMIESCDCTVIIDNAAEDRFTSSNERLADERASLAVRTLTELASGPAPRMQQILEITSSGPIATVCSSRLKPGENIQTAVLAALRNPSANLPIEKTQGAVLLYRGPSPIKSGQAAQAYEALESMIGHRVRFAYYSVVDQLDSTICLLLTGYDYGTALRAFADFIEDLYDIEYGQPFHGPFLGVQMSLFQMERP